jgi:hypothetical protein
MLFEQAPASPPGGNYPPGGRPDLAELGLAQVDLVPAQAELPCGGSKRCARIWSLGHGQGPGSSS